ncbi:MAG: TIGR02206 family membrane protein [Clostridiales bacterium]|nr:TIGR02206 family membrane protein [Clostridiales bacterium]
MKFAKFILWNKVFHSTVFFVCIALVALADILGFFLMQGDSDFRRGIAVYSPEQNSVRQSQFTVDGVAYAREGIDTLEIIATDRGGGERAFPFDRHAVMYDGDPILELASYTAEVDLPEDGEYRLVARMKTTEGEVVDGIALDVRVDAASTPSPFVTFSATHFLTLAVPALFAIGIILWARRGSDKTKQICRIILAVGISAFELVIMYNLALSRHFRISYDLPLHLCSIAIWLIPVLMLTQNKKLKEFLYQLLFLWGLAGASQALLTPDLSMYPVMGVKYICYFGTHGLIIAGVLFATYVDGHRPKWRAFPKVLLTTVICGGIAFGVSHLVRLLPPYEAGGYFYLAYPPISGSLIDVFVDLLGPSPYYMIGLLLLLPIAQAILMLPVWLADTVVRGVRGKRGQA